MTNVPFYKAGQLGVNKDIPPEEQDPREWSDVRNVRMLDGKLRRGFADSSVFGTHIATPYWNFPVQSGALALWIYANIGGVGNDSFTKVLLHMDGVDAATAFPDTNTGGGAHAWTAAGNAQIDTADSVFGGSSGLFDGTGDWLTTPDHADFTLAADFTINVRFKLNGGDGTLRYIAGQNDNTLTAAASAWHLDRLAAGPIRFAVSNGAAFTNLDSPANYTTASNPGWHDLEIVRSGNTLFMFIDGTQVATTAFAGTVPNSASVLGVGVAGAAAANGWFGWLDEFRLSVGIARHILPFTPALDAFGLVTEANLYITDGNTHANASRIIAGIPTPYTVDAKNLWHGGTLSQIPIITNGIDVPQMWLSPSMSTKFANLSNWPVGDRCELIKPFKQFMVAMVIARGGTSYKHLVKWSHPAVPGAVPSSWDEADPTKLAGEVEILDEFPGGIRDGLGLRDTFVIYKDNTTWGMQFIGGNAVFRFYPIFLQSGILSRHCVSNLNNGTNHFVATGDDFIIHDGQNARSVFNKKMRNWIYSTLPTTLSDYCFTAVKPSKNEVWFCFPEDGGQFPTLAAVYNWQDDTVTIRDFVVPISHIDIGPVAATSDPWDADTATWTSDTTVWDLSLFSPHFLQFIGSGPSVNSLRQVDDQINYATGYAERTGLAIIGQDRVSGALKADNEVMKLADRIWPKATGTAFYVQLGAQELEDSSVVYEAQQLFTPGVDKYLDFSPVNGRFLAVKFTWQGFGMTEIRGYDLNIQVLGQQ